MVMHALDRKLLRDFIRLWAQALAIAMVLACGVAALLTSFGMYQALGDSRDAYDVFLIKKDGTTSVFQSYAAVE